MKTMRNSTTARNAETLPKKAVSLGTGGPTSLIVTGRNTKMAKTAMKSVVTSLLTKVFTLALATIRLTSVLPLRGKTEPERSEKMDWNETSL
jgi:hypothetical protein